jgi:hypothetical protein
MRRSDELGYERSVKTESELLYAFEGSMLVWQYILRGNDHMV